ncbi:MAG: phosphotransferase [Oscillospiraceae bacterium]|nr:phosphotransferase [Oscillospiraceae bacterium]
MIHSEPLRSYLTSGAFLSPLGLPAGTELEFSILGQGEYNLNYAFSHPVTGQKLVLRINLGSQMHLEDQIGYEFSALQALVPSGRTPKPLFCDSERNLLVMEWLPGGPLDYHRDMDTAAEILADIHSVPVPAGCQLLRPAAPARAIYDECLEMVQHYFNWADADPEVCRLLRELIAEIGKLPLTDASGAPVCIVNTELNSGNFLMDPTGRSHLVDWEKPLLSEPAQDLGHFLAPTTTFWKTDVILTPEEVRRFADRYIAAVGDRMDTSTLRQRLPLFFTVTCLRGVTWSAMALREYCQPGRQLRNADTFAKLKAYINTEFLTNILENYVRKDFLA